MKDAHAQDNVGLYAFVHFVQTARAVLKYADSCFNKEEALSLVKFIVLHSLANSDRMFTLSEIASLTNTERHNITTLVERLEKDGLVKTRRNRRDRRVVNVKITDKGKNILTTGLTIARQIANQIIPAKDTNDSATFVEQLSIMKKNAYDGMGRVDPYP
ncbi:MarR family winged helix-turn-helix transcriptional regulator [Chloroflexota bacterium]